MSQELTNDEIVRTALGVMAGLGSAPETDHITIKNASKAIVYGSSAGMIQMQRKCLAVLYEMRKKNETETPDEYLRKAISDELTIAIDRILRIDITKVMKEE